MRFNEHYFKENKLDNWVELQNKYPELKAAVEILRKLSSTGKTALIVGGTVRDLLNGGEPNDIDIATNLPINEVEKIFPSHNIGQNKTFGVIVIEYKGYNFEVANFRADLYNDLAKGKGADKVEIVNDFEADSSRRDFTVNSLGVDAEGNLVDHFNGQGDIKRKIIASVGDPNLRFKEDQIRTMRGVRLASKLGFSIDKQTLDAIRSNAPEIKKVAAERITNEILKAAKGTGKQFAHFIELLDEANLLQYVLPEIYGLKDLKHNPIHHSEGNSTVLGHVIETIRANPIADETLNMCSLFHDIGKGTSYQDIDGQEYKNFHGHAGESKPIIEKIAERMKLDNKLKDAVIFCAENHMHFSEIAKGELSNNKLANLMSNPNWNVLYATAKADWMARGDKFRKDDWNKVDKRINDLKIKFKDRDAITTIKKAYDGNLIMKLRNIDKPSAEVGKIQKAVVDYVLNNNLDINNDKQKILDYIMKA